VTKVTPSGAFTEYPIPSGGVGPAGIAAGPDGNLWFTEWRVNQVAKVTTSGVFTEYPVPTASSTPWGIAAGPDGNLWFTEYAQTANQIAKVTTSGVFTEYPISSANSFPYAIAAGPDGNLWFTEVGTENVAKVTTSGLVTEYPCCVSYGIAAGPDGNVWFTGSQTNAIDKIEAGGATDVDLSIATTDSPDPVNTHQQVTYTIAVSNLAPSIDATGVTVMSPLSAHVTFVSAIPSQGTCSTSKAKGATTVTCAIGTLAGGASATITLAVKPLQPGTLTNTTSVASSVTDRNPANNTAQELTSVLK